MTRLTNFYRLLVSSTQFCNFHDACDSLLGPVISIKHSSTSNYMCALYRGYVMPRLTQAIPIRNAVFTDHHRVDG
jgi:hypothetical protein